MSDDDETFATADEAIAAAMVQLVADLGLWARDLGASEERIVRLQARFKHLLHERRETMRVMLEARATNLH
jgi:hypothetical protein